VKIKVETERKYYSMEPEKLVKVAEELNFKLVKKVLETDEYFTDIDSLYIKNRTCLRIRKQDNDSMEITFKGKSSDLLGQYCKLENNISCKADEYENFISLFTALGYYSYSTVEKGRLVYELKNDKYTYNLMIDKLLGIGGFVEFEIISEKETAGREELKKELEMFVSKFSKLNLKEANEPYRDIVAKSIYNRYVNSDDINRIYINLDKVVLDYEKDFFKKNKDKISQLCGTNIKWGTYKKNAEVESKIASLIKEYLDNIIFDGKEILVAGELLQRLNYENIFVTKANEKFFTELFKKLNIETKNVIYLKEQTLCQVVKDKNDLKKSIVIMDREIKDINSILLIIINNR